MGINLAWMDTAKGSSQGPNQPPKCLCSCHWCKKCPRWFYLQPLWLYGDQTALGARRLCGDSDPVVFEKKILLTACDSTDEW